LCAPAWVLLNACNGNAKPANVVYEYKHDSIVYLVSGPSEVKNSNGTASVRYILEIDVSGKQSFNHLFFQYKMSDVVSLNDGTRRLTPVDLIFESGIQHKKYRYVIYFDEINSLNQPYHFVLEDSIYHQVDARILIK
jgi:hypothetical protein